MPSARDLLMRLQQRAAAPAASLPDLDWTELEQRLLSRPAALKALAALDASGGEPAVVALQTDGRWCIADCAAESPAGRRSLCYDAAALEARKENKPQGSAVAQAEAIGVSLLDEAEYRRWAADFGPWDRKTSSWVLTPPEVRALGGALFCDTRYDRVWTYHNGAGSYYAARGWRGVLRV